MTRQVVVAGNDRGSASLLVVAVILVTVVTGGVALGIGEFAAGRSSAASAADLAALAGADSLLEADGGCERSGALAKRNSARLITCHVEGSDVIVEVQAPLPGLVASFARRAGAAPPKLRARARAGPPECDGLPTGADLCQSGARKP